MGEGLGVAGPLPPAAAAGALLGCEGGRRGGSRCNGSPGKGHAGQLWSWGGGCPCAAASAGSAGTATHEWAPRGGEGSSGARSS